MYAKLITSAIVFNHEGFTCHPNMRTNMQTIMQVRTNMQKKPKLKERKTKPNAKHL